MEQTGRGDDSFPELSPAFFTGVGIGKESVFCLADHDKLFVRIKLFCLPGLHETGDDTSQFAAG